MRVIAEVEEALGPGVEFDPDDGHGVLGQRARTGHGWLGFDRAAVSESDDGSGRRLPLLVGLPASTFMGARLSVELVGGWRSVGRTLLIGCLPGSALPVPELARIAGNLAEGSTWIDREAAQRLVRESRQRFRERRSHERIVGGRAWMGAGVLPPDLARYATPHSAAEYRLGRLPPRYLRGLQGLLDDDERVLYWIERPIRRDVGVLERLARARDRRGAIVVLTDRQLLWMIDHADPDRFLSDWGVDIELVPNERVLEARVLPRAGVASLRITTAAGDRVFSLPEELAAEVEVLRDLITGFTPTAADGRPRRRYPLVPIPFDPEPARRFGVELEADALFGNAVRSGQPLAFLLSPRRPGQRSTSALVLRETELELLGPRIERRPLNTVASISLTLSPLIGRLGFSSKARLAVPAPLMDQGAAFARLARRAVANQ